jgi:hypothetical protein
MKRTILLQLILMGVCGVFQAVYSQEERIQMLEQYMQRQLTDIGEHAFITGGIKSGFRANMLVQIHRYELNKTLRQRFFNKVASRPEREKTLATPSGHFLLHWDETGEHAVPLLDSLNNGIPDYIDSAMVVLEDVWRIEIDSLGFQPPFNSEGLPIETYDIYFSELASKGWYGVTWPDYDDIPALPGLNFTSYIELDRDYDSGFYTLGLDGLRVTAAHEFNHAIQLCYNFREEDLFFYEMTSTWLEEVLYPDVNDYFQYLSLIFNDVSNTAFDRYQSINDPYPYANALYLYMLGKEKGNEIVSMVWEEIKNDKVMKALPNTLTKNGISWLESLSTYGTWLYYTGDRSQEGRYFPEAAYYDQIMIKEDDRYTGLLSDKIYKSIDREANRYLEITNFPSPQVQLGVLGEDASSQGYHLLQRTVPSVLYLANQQISVMLAEPDTFVLLLTNAQESQSTFSIVQEISKWETTVYPNPLIVKKQTEKINFINIPADATVYIYTVTGFLVEQFTAANSGSILSWDLCNTRGQAVSSGVYLYRIEGKKISETGKFVIIR